MACRITDYMSLDWIVPELQARDKNAVLLEIAALLAHSSLKVNQAELFGRLIEREQKASTGADHGVALPHATIDSIDRMVIVFGKSALGIPFHALDNENSKLFFAIISPSRTRPEDASYLQVISAVCRLMRSATLRKQLLSASSRRDILELLSTEEEQRRNQPMSIAP